MLLLLMMMMILLGTTGAEVTIEDILLIGYLLIRVRVVRIVASSRA